MEPMDLLEQLADGGARSGEALARTFGVSRAAIWKQMAKLKDWELEVHAVPGNGYCLSRPLDLLDREMLQLRAARRGAVPIERIEIFTALESTNRHLLAASAPRPGTLRACLAEYQTAGRGRRGRSWRAPLGSGLCLSVAWRFEETPPDLAALTLAVGVVIRRALRRGGADVQLKWPNDLVWDDRKLGGILVELSAEAHGGCHVVIGVGLNVSMPRHLLSEVCDWPRGGVDLAEAAGGAAPRRTSLALDAIEALAALLAGYPATGFTPYHREWLAADYLGGKTVLFGSGGRGTARGIDADGALRVETAAGVERVISGDVSVRPAL
jgi:BirA family biotin operon repressor/biotin-[acetyl-CoA-carboxylase] ligase